MADDVRVSEAIRLVPDRLDSPAGAALASAHLAEMETRYDSPDEADGLEPDHLAPPHGTFLVAWLGDVAVGCGGLRRIDSSVAEIKRMFVTATARRHGIARTVLEELVEQARALGYERLILETGTKQPEAIALYTSHGFEPIEPYGVYRDSPFSRCFAKDLG